MAKNPELEWIPFAKVSDKDLKAIAPIFKKNKINYKTEQLDNAIEEEASKNKVSLLYINPKTKHEAQKIIDKILLEKKLKNNKNTTSHSSDKRLIAIAVLIIVVVLIRQYLEFTS